MIGVELIGRSAYEKEVDLVGNIHNRRNFISGDYVRGSVAVMGLLDTAYTIESGTVQVKDSVDDAWIIRDDTVYSAKEDASMDALVKDGALVKGKSRVAALKAGGSQTLGPKYMKLQP